MKSPIPPDNAFERVQLRRVFLDCTGTKSSRYQTGIQRVTRSLVAASLTIEGPWTCEAVVYNGRYFETTSKFVAASGSERGISARVGPVQRMRRWFNGLRDALDQLTPGAANRGILHSQRLEYVLRRCVYVVRNAGTWLRSFLVANAPRVEFRRGDILLLLDSNGSIEIWGELARARDAGAHVWVLIYDLIPIAYPELAPEGTSILIEKWLRRVVPYARGLLAISSTVADDLRAYLSDSGIARDEVVVDYFYPGATLESVSMQGDALDIVSATLARNGNSTYLMVGTIEPRKNHLMVLNVFERLWAEGVHARLCIFGRLGWRSERFARRLRKYPENGGRLLWFEDGTDADLDVAYRHSKALIFASRCEGFGLPLVEAMQYALPVLASDIAVFREIGGDYPSYFACDDEEALYQAIRQFESAGPAVRPMAARRWLTWSDSARMMLGKITG